MRNLSIGTFVLFITLASFSNFSSAYAQNCNSELTVYKNRDARSVSINNPTEFRLTLTNNSNIAQTYQIDTSELLSSCEHNGNNLIDSRSNQVLGVTIVNGKNNSNSITVPAYGSVDFSAAVSVPSNGIYDSWTCINVTANSANCNNGSVSKTIKVFVRNPSDN